MKSTDFDKILDDIFENIKNLSNTKGVEYTVSTDNKFHNFETAGKFLGLRNTTILGVYLYKHFASIFNYLKTGKVKSNETIESRILDAILYLCLLYGMVIDEKENSNL